MLILLIGKISSGKSTAAKILSEVFGLKEEMFAQPLKDFAVSIGFSHQEVYGTQEQKLAINDFWGISGREFMQRFGTDVCRELLPKAIPNMRLGDRQLWAAVMEKKIKEIGGIVISDGRFPDEVRLVKQYGGIVLKIYRDDIKSSTKDSVEHKHVSESYIDDLQFDMLVENNGTINELKTELTNMVKYLLDTNIIKDNRQSKNKRVPYIEATIDSGILME